MGEPVFLISGATGATGGATAAQLLARKRRVRVLVHRQDERSERLKKLGADVILGDFLDLEEMRAALKGAQRAYFCYPIRPGIVQAAAHFAQAATENGVEFIVNMSQKSARGDAKSHAAQQHWLSERVFDWSGVPTAHIRPTYFAEWLLYLAPMIRQGMMLAPFSTTGRHAPIAAEDQARVIVAMLEHPGPHEGKTYPLFGAVELTHPEIAEKVGRVLDREIVYQQVDIEQFAKLLSSGPKVSPQNTAAGFYGESDKAADAGSSYLISHLREVAIDHHNGIFAGMNDVVSTIGGQAPLTVEQFVEQHRELFA